MTSWEQQVAEYKAKFASDPWNPYGPQAKIGFGELAVHENLACVLCDSLVKAIKITKEGQIVVNTDGSIEIGCDYDMGSGYRKVAIIPDSSVKGGATVSANSGHGCGRGLLNR